MEENNPEEIGSEQGPRAEAGDPSGSFGDLTTQALVDRMVEAGEWPRPSLLEAILARGQEAVGPLLEVMREFPEGWPEEAPLTHAMGLLGDLKAREAIPRICDVLRHYDGE